MSTFNSNINLIKLFSLCFVLMSAFHSWNLYKVGTEKLDKQVAINENVEQVKQTWKALQPTLNKWQQTFLHNDLVSDLVSLNSNLNIHPTGLIPQDRVLSEGSSEVIVFEGSDIGLAERCIKNNSRGYEVTAPTVAAFMNGMSTIDKRPDLNWKKVIIRANEDGFSITYSELCSRYRIGV